MSKDPPWVRDELILALSLYISGGRVQLTPNDPRVQRLSELLNSLPLHPLEKRTSSFRSASSVSMKLGNFQSIDPEYEGLGLSRGGNLDQRVWDEFAHDPGRLHKTAAAIRQTYPTLDTGHSLTQDENEEFREGSILTRIHKKRERNRRLVERKKQKVLTETGRLACEVCGFDFEETYGDLGHGFAECHHLTPLSELRKSQPVSLSDLALVCANCHRMLHIGETLLTISELRDHLRIT